MVSNAYILAAVEAMKEQYPIDPDRVYVLGHSEGGVLAYGVALRHPGLFRGLVVIGARLRSEETTAEVLEPADDQLQVLVCHSREDQMIGFEAAEEAHKTLKRAGFQSKLLTYAGGHGLTKELVMAIAAWIDRDAGKKQR